VGSLIRKAKGLYSQAQQAKQRPLASDAEGSGSGMKREIEIKLRVASVAALKRQLRAVGARCGKRLLESNLVFDAPDGRFRRRDELVRLRTVGGKCVFTFKGRSLPGAGARGGKYKVRSETEFAVSTMKQGVAIIRALGLQQTFRYEKYRTEISAPGASGVHICLDETPLGPFLEIEGPRRAIDAAARLLGYRPADYVTASYLALWAEDCRKRRRPFADFVFPRRKDGKRR